jgi:putative FmdB family regulatory protein
MPVYEYRCDRGHTFEVIQPMTDDPVTSCSTCNAPVQRVFHPVAVHFKGSGFYTTDYAKKKATAPSDSSPKGDSKPESRESKDTKESKPSGSAKKSD